MATVWQISQMERTPEDNDVSVICSVVFTQACKDAYAAHIASTAP